jgi:hypothetical protein
MQPNKAVLSAMHTKRAAVCYSPLKTIGRPRKRPAPEAMRDGEVEEAEPLFETRRRGLRVPTAGRSNLLKQHATEIVSHSPQTIVSQASVSASLSEAYEPVVNRSEADSSATE